MRPLDGVTVVALEQAVSVPLATRHLADHGARVIKIERPGVGDFARAYDAKVKGLSSHFVWLNRSKESLTLDLARPEARDVLFRLLDSADVFVQNLAPGAAERLGLGVGPLRSAHSRLIVCGVSGYGTTGPYRDKKAYDLLVQAEAGLLSITGTVDEPVKVGIAVADIAAGMYAYPAILTALLMRHRSGNGTSIEVSMLDALGEWMGYPLYYTAYDGGTLPRSGAQHVAIAPYGPFAGADGEVVYLGVQNEREWVAFCEHVLRRVEVSTDPRFSSNAARVEHRAALHREVDAVLSQLPAQEIIARLERARIASGRLNTVGQFAAHPQLVSRDRWREVASAAGRIRATLPPADIEGVDPRFDPIPSVGQHTDAILGELGYAPTMVDQWHAAGIV